MFQEDVHQNFPSFLPSSVRQQEIRVTWNVADPLHCYKALHLLQQRLRSSHRPASFLVTEYTCLCYFSKQQLYFELNYKCKFSAVVSHRLDTVYPVIYSRTLLHNLSSSSGHAGSNYSKAPWALQSSWKLYSQFNLGTKFPGVQSGSCLGTCRPLLEKSDLLLHFKGLF